MELRWRPTPASLAPRLARAARDGLTSGRTAVLDDGEPPGGHARLEAVTGVERSDGAFARLSGALLRWGVHRGARMVVATDGDGAAPGATIVNAGPFGPVAVLAPCRVVEVVDEPDRRGFVYATLPGHPLVGEESFTVERSPAGEVRFRIRSFSRPVGVAGLAPPATRAFQQLVNRRYLAAARRLALA